MIILTRGEGRTLIYVKTVDSKGRVRVKLSSSGLVSHILNIHYNPAQTHTGYTRVDTLYSSIICVSYINICFPALEIF